MIKTKTIKVTTFTKPKRIEKEETVLDRDYYIPKLIKQEKKDEKNIVIELSGGCLSEVHNIPDGHKYTLIDWDNLKECDEDEFKEEIDGLID